MSLSSVFKRILAISLSLVTLTTICKPANAIETKRMLTIGGLSVFGAASVITVGALINHFGKSKEFKQIPVQSVDIESMSDEAVQKYLEEQVSKFESMGDGKTFVIGHDVKTKANPKILALVCKGLNEIFSQYPLLPKYLIKINARYRNKIFKNPLNPKGEFKIQFLDKSTPNYSRIVAQCLFGDGVAFNKELMCGTLKDVVDLAKEQVIKGAHSKLNFKMLIEAGVAHEIGHIIGFLVCSGNAKGEVIRIARNMNKNLADAKISTTGEINESEWFAEVFAHSMYGEKQNDLSYAMRQYLHNEFKILQKSNTLSHH